MIVGDITGVGVQRVPGPDDPRVGRAEQELRARDSRARRPRDGHLATRDRGLSAQLRRRLRELKCEARLGVRHQL